MFLVVPICIVILILLFRKAVFGIMEERNESIVRGIAKNIFWDRQDITDYILDEKYRLVPIDKDKNYAKLICVNGQQQVLVNIRNKYVVYNPNIETVLETPQECIPICYLFKYQKKGETKWYELYIVYVPFDSVRGVIKD